MFFCSDFEFEFANRDGLILYVYKKSGTSSSASANCTVLEVAVVRSPGSLIQFRKISHE